MKWGLFLFFIVSGLMTVAQSNEKDTLMLIPFAFDSDEVRDAELAFKKLVDEHKGKPLFLHGYTDAIGAPTYNLKLAERRINSVVSIFQSLGVEDSLITKEAKGILTNFPESEGRVVIVLSDKPKEEEKEQLVKEIVDIKSKTDSWEAIKAARKREEAERLKAIEEEKLAAKKKLKEELDKGEVITIDGIEFVPGESTLMDYSKPALLSLLELLESNPDLKIEIQGHICCSKQFEGLDQKTGKYNLSEMRAKSVYELLIKNGISKKRLSYKGYGNSRPLYPETSSENMQRNRRVSIQSVNY